MPDFKKISNIIVNKCLQIREGEVVNLAGGMHTVELFEEVYLAIKKAGGFVIPLLTYDRLERRMLLEVPLKYLARLSPHRIPMMDYVDASIAIGDNEDPALLSDIPEEKLGEIRNALTPLRFKVLERKRAIKYRTLYIGFPTEKGAQSYGVPFPEYSEIFWKAVDIDFESMRSIEERIAGFLRGKDKIHIKADGGTNVDFSIKDRIPLLDGGILTMEDLAQGNTNVNLPCGEVWIAPREDSANGVAVFPSVFYQGREILDLALYFEGGRVKSVDASKNVEIFQQLLENSSGDKDIIAEFGIGCNPEVTRLCNDNLLDEKMEGTIHIAIGSNEFFGGKNNSTLHKDMILMHPSVWVDGEMFISAGKLLFGERKDAPPAGSRT